MAGTAKTPGAFCNAKFTPSEAYWALIWVPLGNVVKSMVVWARAPIGGSARTTAMKSANLNSFVARLLLIDGSWPVSTGSVVIIGCFTSVFIDPFAE